MGSKSRSRIFRVSRVSDQPITMGTRICIQYRYKFHRRARDSSQMCDNKVHAQAACAPDEDSRKAHGKAQSGRDRARPLRARAPDPGADDTRVSRCPRRYARCSWTRRCARAMICDRAASRSASSRRARVEWVCKGRAVRTCSSTNSSLRSQSKLVAGTRRLPARHRHLLQNFVASKNCVQSCANRRGSALFDYILNLGARGRARLRLT